MSLAYREGAADPGKGEVFQLGPEKVRDGGRQTEVRCMVGSRNQPKLVTGAEGSGASWHHETGKVVLKAGCAQLMRN